MAQENNSELNKPNKSERSLNGKRIENFETISDFAKERITEIKDTLYFIAQVYGEGIKEDIVDIQDELFDKLFETIIPYKQYNFKEDELKLFIELKKEYLEEGLFYKMVGKFKEILYTTEKARGVNLAKNDFDVVFRGKFESFKKSTEFDYHGMVSKIIAGRIIYNSYNNIVKLNDSDFDYVKGISMIGFLVNGMNEYFKDDEVSIKLVEPIKELNMGGYNILGTELKNVSQLSALLKILFASISHQPEQFQSIINKLNSKGISHSEPVENMQLISFNLGYDDLDQMDIDFTEMEKLLIGLHTFSSGQDGVSLILNNPGMGGMEFDEYATPIAELLNQLYRTLWVSQQVKKEERLTPPKDLRKFRKKISETYRIYTDLFDTYINPNSRLRQEDSTEGVTDNLLEQADELKLEISDSLGSQPVGEKIQNDAYQYEYKPFKQKGQSEEVQTEVMETKPSQESVSNRLSNYGEKGELKNIKINPTLLAYIDSVIDYVDNFDNNVSSLAQSISYEMKYQSEILYKKNEVRKRMIIGKKLENAIKINITTGDRMIVYVENNKPQIMILNASEYHDNRGKLNS